MSNAAPFDWTNAIPLSTPALGTMLQYRADQIGKHGHTPAADDATGPGPMVHAARGKLLKALQHDFAKADQQLQAAGDMTMGDIAILDSASLATLYARALTAGAICLAIGDLIDRERANRAGDGR